MKTKHEIEKKPRAFRKNSKILYVVLMHQSHNPQQQTGHTDQQQIDAGNQQADLFIELLRMKVACRNSHSHVLTQWLYFKRVLGEREKNHESFILPL